MSVAYPLIMLLAVVGGVLTSRLTWQRSTLDRSERIFIGLSAFSGAMLAAKLPFLPDEIAHSMGGQTVLSGGKTIMAGLVGGYFGVELAKWYLGITEKTGDSFAVPVAVSIGIGRLACFVGGCCYGQPTGMPWAVVFPSVDQLPRHPTQIYESIFHLACAALLYHFFRQGWFRFQLIKLYILSYFAYRFATEFIRPEPRVLMGLTAYQIAAIIFAPVFVWLWIRDARNAG